MAAIVGAGARSPRLQSSSSSSASSSGRPRADPATDTRAFGASFVVAETATVVGEML